MKTYTNKKGVINRYIEKIKSPIEIKYLFEIATSFPMVYEDFNADTKIEKGRIKVIGLIFYPSKNTKYNESLYLYEDASNRLYGLSNEH